MAFKTLGGGEFEGEAPIVAEINITPLTDIFLVLLIIFMVTSSALSQTGVSVDLPKASQATATSQPDGVIVSLLPGGRIQVNQKELRQGAPGSPGFYDALEKSLKQALLLTQSKLVILEGDRQSFLGSAIEVMDHARKAGAQKFAIATSPEESKRK